MIQGLLSVIIPTYRRDFALLRRALDSVTAQTYAPIDILVVDDNREGDERYSQEIKDGLAAYPSAGYCRTEGGNGAQRARNTGIAHSEGEFLAFLDDDDEWLPELASKEIALLRSVEGAGMAFSMGYTVDESVSPPTVKMYCEKNNFVPRPTFRDMLLQDRIGTTTQAIVRREAFEKVGGFDVEQVARQDYEMWLRIGKAFKLVGVPEPLFRHYIHSGGQISKGYDRAIAGLERVYRKYAADYAGYLGAKEKQELTLADLYDRNGIPDQAKKWRARARMTRVKGAFKVLLQPQKWLSVLRGRKVRRA